MPKRALIKVRLHDRNEDSESVWAKDLGPVKGKRGARRVRITNICYLHAKPTLHDVIVVEPDPEDDDYMLQWDRRGVSEKRLGTRIAEDGGRFAMIVDYQYGARGDRWRALVKAVTRRGLDIEGMYGPRDGEPGRAYLAVDRALTPARVMDILRASDAGYTFAQIHPKPRAARASGRKSRRRSAAAGGRGRSRAGSRARRRMAPSCRGSRGARR